QQWLLDGKTGVAVPRDAASILDAAAGGPLAPGAANSGAWEAFFSAFHETPTPAERRALATFELAHPHLAIEMRALAGDVAQAQSLRDRAFSSLTPADWRELPGAVAQATVGDPLTPEQRKAVSRIDFGDLAQ